MGLPDSFVISPGDIQLLPQALQAASCFEDCPPDAEMASLMAEFDIKPVFPGW